METRISRLPRPLQPVARRIRSTRVGELFARSVYVYEADGLATSHYSPFLSDEKFSAAYEKVRALYGPENADVRWRVYLLVEIARHASRLDAAFAEFGTYRGADTFMVLSMLGNREFFCFDTFAGIPTEHLTERENAEGFAGRLSNTTVEDVRRRLHWPGVELVVGDVFDTLPVTETGPLAFAHLDLNAAGATEASLSYVLERLVPGGAVVFDDYGWDGYEDQRVAIQGLLGDRVMALPTGQGLFLS